MKKIKRKLFLKLSSLSIIGAATTPIGLSECQTKKTSGKIFGANHQIGHLLKKALNLPVSQKIDKKITIVGSGIAGLAAGYFLKKAGINDFQILELESNIGGNAAHGENINGAFPWGAHYLPLPSLTNIELLSFLEDIGVITGYNHDGLPIYNSYYLCFAPEERLFKDGYWQDGLIPSIGVDVNEKRQISRFFELMNEFKWKKGKDNKWIFDIPMSIASKHHTYFELDSKTMNDWLQINQFDSEALRWYINYCLLDDYGTDLANCSAFAGIHYFASRRGKAANAEENDVLTWNEGNAFLMKKLAENQLSNIKTSKLVHQISIKNDKVIVSIYDWKQNVISECTSDYVIYAGPQMLRPYIFKNFKSDFCKDFSYSPWLVANLLVEPFDTGKGQSLTWDNVIYNGKGLGYIFSNNQDLKSHNTKWNFTYYKALIEASPSEERQKALSKTYEMWKNEILNDLKLAHPNIDKYVIQLDLKIWGHAMVRPTPNFISGQNRLKAQLPIENKIYFAHSDLSGFSLFEEAFYSGYQAATSIGNKLTSYAKLD